MKKFAIGFLLIFLNFNLNFNQFSLNVLPDFVGYYLLLKGMAEMETENPRFAAPRVFATGMVIYTAILWIGNLLGVSGGLLVMVLNLIALVVHFYIAWVLVCALREVEAAHQADLYGAVLAKRWKILLGLNVAAQLLRVVAMAAPMDVLGMAAAVLVLADIIWAFLFILGWNRAAGLWEELQTAPAGTAAAESEAPAGEPSEGDGADMAGEPAAAPEEPAETEE